MALAADEKSRHQPHAISTRAEPSGNGFRLTGSKSFVLDGHVADRLIVAARTAGDDEDTTGITLFLRVAQTVIKPNKVRYPCERCGLQTHDPDAVHCKACGNLLCIPDEG